MRVAINLASRPYLDETRFYRRWGTGLVLMILFTAFMAWASVHHYYQSRKEWASARAAQAKLAELQKEEVEARRILNEPQNRGTRDESQFLNAAILKKSFSWTRLMTDLEKVMPAGVRVVSIAPNLDQKNRFALKLAVEGPTREGAVQLVRNMEKSQHFRSSMITAERASEGNAGREAGVKSEITSTYTPAETLELGAE
jgi:type IV pilus assembly protein PilN